ncbi:uncharacterized protein LTR77_005171 [Saxophila tyrrhenica]|uniref:Glycosyl transferase CAP10 domain-containing protein n=1 Tax=Saxophila tyrrhenica TaxID=1690608 RepID=A0AAV9PFA1_9PEZI|nr:hypothetical protein LTR77_005171 [Saxophila tyrrhenica]
MPLISAPSLNSRFTQLVIAAGCLITIFWFFAPSYYTINPGDVPPLTAPPAPEQRPDFTPPQAPAKPRPNHPIDHLIAEADREFNDLLSKETNNLHDAAQAYRNRRGRQPPPGFDRWFEFAQNHSAVMVEDFWDRIYHDLNPFWGVPAKQIREQANDILFRISVRKGNVTFRGDGEDRPWLNLWGNLTQTVAEWLPDLDMPINHMDESRMVVEWEEINKYMQAEQANRRIVSDDKLIEDFQTLEDMDKHPPPKFDPEWMKQGPYWPLAVVGCPPGSPARQAYIETDFRTPPPLLTTYPEGSYEGYVQNWTLAKSPCDNAHLQGLHGTFVEPISLSTTKQFFPLFGGSKLPMNNEILLPAAMYWTEDPFYSGGEDHGEAWRLKKTGLIWRGAASGGRNTKDNWTRFQRHRFLSMVNATSVKTLETNPAEGAPNFALPANGSYELVTQSPDAQPGAMGEWVDSWSDAGPVHLLCFPQERKENPPKEGPKFKKSCSYTDPYFSIASMVKMKDQYDYKYLPDIDGNSFSGRYRGFLGSTSLPVKATIYEEWHDSRLVPWKHFVPMDNTFVDFYGIMEYFVGNEKFGVVGHDEVARSLAIGGKQWAEKVLRREDMQIYVLRLLLEYARISDDRREVMGWRENKPGGGDVT